MSDALDRLTGNGIVGTAPEQRPDGRYEDGDDVVLVSMGETFVLPPLETEDLDALETYYRENCKPAVTALNDVVRELERADPKIREGLMDRAFATVRQGPKLANVTRQELGQWLDTTEGTAYALYVQLRKRYPDMTPEKGKTILRTVGLAEVLRKRDQASKQLADIRDRAARLGILDQITKG